MILGTKVRIFIRFRLVAAYFYSFTPLSQSSEVGYIPVLAYLCLRPCLLVPAPVPVDMPVSLKNAIIVLLYKPIGRMWPVGFFDLLKQNSYFCLRFIKAIAYEDFSYRKHQATGCLYHRE